MKKSGHRFRKDIQASYFVPFYLELFYNFIVEKEREREREDILKNFMIRLTKNKLYRLVRFVE